MMSEPYKRLSEEESTVSDSSRFQANNGPQNPTPPVAGPRILVSQPTSLPRTKLYAARSMKFLAFSQLGLSIVIFLFTIICFIVTISHSRLTPPVDGTGIWNGILAIIAASFGVAATIRGYYGGRCTMVTYFVLSIIVTVFMGFLVIMSAAWSAMVGSRLSDYNYYLKKLARWEEREKSRIHGVSTTTSRYGYHGYDQYGYHDERPYNYYGDPNLLRAALGLHLTIGVMAFFHMVSTIVSLALICYNWNKTGCCGVQSTGTYPNVVYVPGTNVVGSQPIVQSQMQHQFVIVPLANLQQQDVRVPLVQAAGSQGTPAPVSGHTPPPAYTH